MKKLEEPLMKSPDPDDDDKHNELIVEPRFP